MTKMDYHVSKCCEAPLTPIKEVEDIVGEGPTATVWKEIHHCENCGAIVVHRINKDERTEDWVNAVKASVVF